MQMGCRPHFLPGFVMQLARDSGDFGLRLFGPSYLYVFRLAAIVSTIVIGKSFNFIELGTTNLH